MAKIIYLVLYILGVSLTKVYAATDAEKSAFADVITECFSEQGVNHEVIETIKKTHNINNIKPCFFGCALKKIDLIDNNGKFAYEKGLAALKNLFRNKEDIAKFEEVGNICLKVNDAPVSDGEAGCDRAKLLVACAIENKLEIPIN